MMPFSSNVHELPLNDGRFGDIQDFLRNWGAETFPHAGGRTLFDHLLGTSRILSHWSQPVWLRDAGALHSIYSTEVYRRQLVPISHRGDVRSLVGEDAERLIYLFCLISRKDFRRQLALCDTTPENGLRIRRHSGGADAAEYVSRQDVHSLIVLDMANTAEQACTSTGEPQPWLAQVSRMGSRLRGYAYPIPPVFASCTALVSSEHEDSALRAYRQAMEAINRNPPEAAHQFSVAWANCPYVAEPCVWQAFISRLNGDSAGAVDWITLARQTLCAWGTPWDKRLCYLTWQRLLSVLEVGALDIVVRIHSAGSTAADSCGFLQKLKEWMDSCDFGEAIPTG